MDLLIILLTHTLYRIFLKYALGMFTYDVFNFVDQKMFINKNQNDQRIYLL